MKKIVFCILSVLLLSSGISFAGKGTHHSDCKVVASVFNDGTGDNRTKKKGGNYSAIKLDTLSEDQVIRIKPVSGNYKYVTLHARFKGGSWRTIYKGPKSEFPVSEYLSKYKKDKNCTHVNISVNGGHEKYEPIACNANILVCDKPKKTSIKTGKCRTVASVFNDGTGDNRTKKRGGNYSAIELSTLSENQILSIKPVSGTFKYVTLHARYKGGYWRTIYKGEKTEFPVSEYISKYKKDPDCTHVNISVNGGHEKYEPIACNANIQVCDPPPKADGKTDKCRTVGSVFNDGTGNNRTKKRGGNYNAIDIKTLSEGQVLKVQPVSGTLKYVTLHARFNGGYWRTIYKGPKSEFPVSEYISKYKKDANCTHVIVSVNGAHEKYEPIACNANILVCDKPETKMDCRTVASIFNDGTGNNRTKKQGGNYAAIPLNSLRSDQVLTVKPVSGNLKYVTLHARYQGGYWRTIYQGPITEFPVSEYFSGYRRDKKCTHVNISVNGAHEKYEPIACNANILVCK